VNTMEFQGQGKTTEYKQRGIQRIIEINLKCVCANPTKYVSRFCYWHLDLHAGGGWNELAGCMGTPLAFKAAMAAHGKEFFRAYFCDKSHPAIHQLFERPEIGPDDRCFVFPGDNREVIAVFAAEIRRIENKPQHANGSIICDPNGYFYGEGVPQDELAEFCREFPKIDLIMNLNVLTLQRMRPHVRKGKGKWGEACLLEISDLPFLLNRKYWLIRNVLQKGGERFVLLVGRNFRIGEDREFGLRFMDSPQGQAILRKIGDPKCTLPLTTSISDTLSFGS
jgi:hypothetical protein